MFAHFGSDRQSKDYLTVNVLFCIQRDGERERERERERDRDRERERQRQRHRERERERERERVRPLRKRQMQSKDYLNAKDLFDIARERGEGGERERERERERGEREREREPTLLNQQSYGWCVSNSKKVTECYCEQLPGAMATEKSIKQAKKQTNK